MAGIIVTCLRSPRIAQSLGFGTHQRSAVDGAVVLKPIAEELTCLWGLFARLDCRPKAKKRCAPSIPARFVFERTAPRARDRHQVPNAVKLTPGCSAMGQAHRRFFPW